MLIETVDFAMGVWFAVVWSGMAINVVWGLLTGGPRARTEPGRPYLYDRLYYFLFLVLIIGALLAFLSSLGKGEDGSRAGFFISGGICFTAFGLIFWLRRKMMKAGSAYLAKHGFILFRPYHFMMVRNFELYPLGLPGYIKDVSRVLVVVGVGVLVFNLLHVPEAVDQVRAGTLELMKIIERLAGDLLQ